VSLKQCYGCGWNVHRRAKSCPRCGARRPGQGDPGKWMKGYFIGGVVFFMLMSLINIIGEVRSAEPTYAPPVDLDALESRNARPVPPRDAHPSLPRVEPRPAANALTREDKAHALRIIQGWYDSAVHKNRECEERQTTWDRVLPGIRTSNCASFPYNGTLGTWGPDYTLFVEARRWEALTADERKLVTDHLRANSQVDAIIVGGRVVSPNLRGHVSLSIDRTVWER
jgi:hypothetical protein